MVITTLIVGLMIIKALTKGIVRLMEKRNVDASLRPFARSLVGVAMKVMLFITTAGMLGIEMTSFIVILGAAGLAVGLALPGTLQGA